MHMILLVFVVVQGLLEPQDTLNRALPKFLHSIWPVPLSDVDIICHFVTLLKFYGNNKLYVHNVVV